MADYEVRHWHGWHRYMTLVMLAHTWLKLIQHTEREKKSVALLVECESGGIAWSVESHPAHAQQNARLSAAVVAVAA